MGENKIKNEGIIAATVKFNNTVDTERVYGIRCEAQFENGNIRSIQSGEVFNLSDNRVLSNFSWYPGNSVSTNITYDENTEATGILTATLDFVDNIKNQSIEK